MQISRRSFPHPVLSHFSDDIVGCAFQATLNIQTTKTSYILSVKNTLSDKYLWSLVNSGHAAFGLHIECRPTRHRKLALFDQPRHQEVLKAGLVDGGVDVCMFVLAVDHIPEYKNPNFHKDYGDHTFSIFKGDILAVAEDRYFYAEKMHDELKRIPSIFLVVAGDEGTTNDIDYDTQGEKIVVTLKRELFDRYKYIRQAYDMQPLLAGLIIVPVLTDILSDMKTSGHQSDLDIGEKRWFKALQKRLEEVNAPYGSANFETSSSLVLAQKLVESPIGPGLEAVAGWFEED